MLEELGQPYRTEILDFGTTMKAPAYLAINPMGKVPAIRHGDVVVTECAAICAYLADAFPQAGPRAAAGRPAARSLLSLDVLRRRPARSRGHQQGVRARGAEGARGHGRLRQLRQCHGRARDRGLQSDYVTGERFSAADVYLGSHIGWGMQFGTIEKRPAFERYWERLKDRPAAKKASAIDDALMPEQKKPSPAN